MKNSFIVLVGPSGAGKTTLMHELIRRRGDRVANIRSLTTRKPRGESDHAEYDFLTKEEILDAFAAGKLTHIAEYAGNYYSINRGDLDKLLSERHGILPFVETYIKNIRDLGYHVMVVRVVPRGHAGRDDERRRQEDLQRAALNVPADLEILNDFTDPNGFENAVRVLSDFIDKLDRAS